VQLNDNDGCDLMTLTIEERQQFLAEPHVAALSVSAGDKRAPVTVPLWYQYEPGGDAWILTPAESVKARLIRAAGRFTLMVQRLEPTVRYVSVEGPVTSTTPGTRDDQYKISARYLPPEMVDGFVAMAVAEHGPKVVIRMRPERWLSADLGGG
jgi:Pyridoxamine 5'-phosphate oxidase